MSRIERLTPEQEALMSIVRDEWINKLGNIKPDKPAILEGLDYLYSTVNKKRPELVIWVNSPLAAQYAYQIIKKILENKHKTAGASVWDSVWASVEDSVEDSVRDSVRDSVGDSVRDSVWASVGASVRDSVWASVGDSVWDSVWASVRDSVGDSVKHDYQQMFQAGSITYWGWFAWVDFYRRIGLELPHQDEIDKLIKLQSMYDGLFYENLAIVCEHPKEVNWTLRNNRKVIHADGKPAVEWEDGFKVYALNGIRVPEKLVITPSHELTLDYYKELSSADHKIEFVAKYGVERMKSLGKVLDTYENYRNHEYWDRYIFGKSKYELIDMSTCYNNDKEAIFLGMVHQGNGMYIMECVGSGVTTIKQALESRIEEDLSNYECSGFH